MTITEAPTAQSIILPSFVILKEFTTRGHEGTVVCVVDFVKVFAPFVAFLSLPIN